MSSNLKIFKFGGASIKDAEAIKNVAKILTAYQSESIVIVVSAMGKTTNALEGILNAYYNQTGKAFELFEALKQAHFTIMESLFEKEDEAFVAINDTFIEIEWIIEEPPQDTYDYLYDQLVSVGEILASKIVAAYLNKVGLATTWLDARDAILTDNSYRESLVDWEVTLKNCQTKVKPMLEANGFILTQGFIGGTSENFTTTLGREGSDYTAAIFAYCLDAESLTIWKDVPGILTGDPRLFKNVTKIDRLSFREAIEMTYYGAKVIHPKTIKPLQNKNIPLYVKSFIKPEGSGTEIMSEVEANYPPVVVVEPNQVMLQIATKDFSFVGEKHLSDLFQKMADLRIKVSMMQNMAISFSVCLRNDPTKIQAFLDQLVMEYNVIKNENLELITIRHYQEEMIAQLTKGKMVVLEGRIRQTIQLVVKDVPLMERI